MSDRLTHSVDSLSLLCVCCGAPYVRPWSRHVWNMSVSACVGRLFPRSLHTESRAGGGEFQTLGTLGHCCPSGQRDHLCISNQQDAQRSPPAQPSVRGKRPHDATCAPQVNTTQTGPCRRKCSMAFVSTSVCAPMFPIGLGGNVSSNGGSILQRQREVSGNGSFSYNNQKLE